MYKWLIFDADGTLFDFATASAAALVETFEFAGITHNDETIAAYYRINHACWEAFERGELSAETLRTERFRQLLTELGHTANADELSNHYIQHLGQGKQLLPGARDLIYVLHTRFDMLLLTNGLAEVQRPRFAATNMPRFFKHTIISDEVGVAKPDPAIFDICFEKMGNPDKSEVLIIGDSLTSDIQGGINYGIDTCWFNPNRRPQASDITPTYEISGLYDLVPML